AAPVMLKTGNVYVPRIGIDKPKKSVTTAPTEAPDDTPRVYGSASGFFSNPWKAAPAIASDAPTSPANKTRGIRIFHRILEAVVSDESQNVLIGMLTVPIETPSHTATRSVAADTM